MSQLVPIDVDLIAQQIRRLRARRLREAFSNRNGRNRVAVVPDEFCRCDIRDPTLIEAVRKFDPDTIIHAAFVVRPMHNAAEMSDINIGGTENVLKIAKQLLPARFLFVSSATVYGAWPDNCLPLAV